MLLPYILLLQSSSRKKWGYFLESCPGSRAQHLHRGQEILVRHPAAEECPSHGLLLRSKEARGLFGSKGTAGGALQTFEIEFNLLHQSSVQHGANFEIAFDRVRAFPWGAGFADRLNHERIESCVLRLFHPVMLEQAL